MELNDDVLNLILSFTQKPECVIVCKKWYNMVIKNSPKCLNCNKITKMYDYCIWQTDDDDLVCHMHALHKNTYKTLDVEITNILPLKSLFEKMLVLMPKMSAFIYFITTSRNYIIIYSKEKEYEFIDENSLMEFFSKFIGKTKNIIVEINVLELYNFINTFSNNEIFLFSVNNKNNLEIKIKNSMYKYKSNPVTNPINSCAIDCSFEIEVYDFSTAICNIKNDTENVEVKCYADKIIFSSKETNKQNIYETGCNENDNFREGIVSIDRNKGRFKDTDILCGTFKLKNILNINAGNLNILNINSVTDIKFFMIHNTSLAITYVNFIGQRIFHLL